MDDNLLNDVDQTPEVDPTKDYLAELVGEGKKFKTVNDLARGKYESDNVFIPKLLKEQQEMRADYLREREENLKRAKFEELVDQFTNKQLANSETTLDAKAVSTEPKYNPDEIKNLVSASYKEEKLREKEQANLSLVRDKLKNRFGDKYPTILKEQMENLGLDDTLINDLARKHPSVLLKTLGVDDQIQEGFQTPPRSESRSAFSPRTDKRTWTHYQKIKQENPTLYWEPKTQLQMMKDAESMGKSFEDGDFNTLR